MGDASRPGMLVKPDDVGETVRLIKKAFAA